MKNIITLLLLGLISPALLAQSTTPFGVPNGTELSEVNGLAGSIYDLKTETDGDQTDVVRDDGKIDIPEVVEIVEKLGKKDFSKKALSKYQQGEVYLAFSNLFFKNIKADAAPAAFDCDYIDPRALLIVYEGTIDKADEGEFRFAGVFDDILLVYINDRIVFDGSFQEGYSRFRAKDNHTKNQLTAKPFAYGSYIKIKPKDKLRIVIGEVPGGFMGGCLLIQKKDEEYKEDSDGFPILPPFCLEPLTDTEIARIEGYGVPVETSKVPTFTVEKPSP